MQTRRDATQRVPSAKEILSSARSVLYRIRITFLCFLYARPLLLADNEDAIAARMVRYGTVRYGLVQSRFRCRRSRRSLFNLFYFIPLLLPLLPSAPRLLAVSFRLYSSISNCSSGNNNRPYYIATLAVASDKSFNASEVNNSKCLFLM